MLALIYFALAVCVGDFFCRRFYQFESVAHRCAAAILVGLLCKLMVHLPGRIGFLLDIASAFVGQSIIFRSIRSHFYRGLNGNAELLNAIRK